LSIPIHRLISPIAHLAGPTLPAAHPKNKKPAEAFASAGS
jgi:hypothetical protein